MDFVDGVFSDESRFCLRMRDAGQGYEGDVVKGMYTAQLGLWYGVQLPMEVGLLCFLSEAI